MAEPTFLKRLVGDLKASWPKTALLGGLFCVGLYFWIPQLYRVIVGGSSAPTAAAPSVAVPIASSATETAANPQGATDVRTATGAETPGSWQKVDELLRSDPLVQSADITTTGDPFRIDFDQFSPPLLFADEPQDEGPSTAESADSQSNQLKASLVLTSTIVGAKRRAALINQKLYREGNDILVGGQTYRLESVFPNRVLLRRGDEQLELTIAKRQPSGTVEFQRE